ncbi:MAG: sensor histidine kinase, partial [Actinomyces sp.]
MRRRVLVVVGAATVMVAVAFLMPLALLVARVAHDRAIDEAEDDARLVVAGLAVSTDPGDLDVVVTRTRAGAEGRLAVYLPDGSVVGAPLAADEHVAEAFTEGRAWTGDLAGGARVVVPVATVDGVVVVRVDVPERLLGAGVAQAWAWLAGVGVALVVGALVLGDRLARSLTRPVTDLERASRRLAGGDLTARVEPDGPDELVAVGRTFNELARRVDDLLRAEREDVADLAHRLRTPLTALRLRLDGLAPAERDRLAVEVDRLGAAVDQLIHEARRRGAPSAEVVDVAPLVAQRAEFWRLLAAEQGRAWDVEVAGPAPVRIDPVELEAALDVIYDNVFTHTAGGARTEVGVDTDRVVVTVDDEGPGILADAVERGHSAGSTGLGLDIARRAATGAGGRVEVGRSPGGGRVRFVLPRADADGPVG